MNSSYFDNMNPRNMLSNVGRNLRLRDDSYYVTDTILPALAVFGAGILVGASVALLLAPKPGYELRNDISRKATEIGENVRNKLPGMTTGGGSFAESGRENRDRDLEMGGGIGGVGSHNT